MQRIPTRIPTVSRRIHPVVAGAAISATLLGLAAFAVLRWLR
jgi:hypothetical protein